MKREIYVVLAMLESTTVTVSGTDVFKLPIADLADGCIGALLVFENKGDAEKWAKGKPVMTLTEEKEDGKS